MSWQQVAKQAIAKVVKYPIKDDPKDLGVYGKDWTQGFESKPGLIVFPSTTTEVAAVLKLCNENGWSVVPSGGRTGLAAGAVAANGEIVLSLEKMNRIISLDPVGLTITVEAGVITEELQRAARDAGLFFPIDLGAKGSCHIGGNIATNAGGLKFIRFGGTREQVLGLEVVLPDGTIMDLDGGLKKDNTGYDLKQLFIGCEGTLGVVTKATLKLAVQPKEVQLLCLASDNFSNIPKILAECFRRRFTVSAFEFFTGRCHELVLQYHPTMRSPFEAKYPYYVLVELEGLSPDGDEITTFLESLFESGLAVDGVLAGSSAEFREIWAHRELITESVAMHGHVHKNDIAVAVKKLSDFVAAMDGVLANSSSNELELVTFGHIGDGNLHVNYIGTKSIPFADFKNQAKQIEKGIFQLVRDFKGSISAEHGIGLLKKDQLEYSRTAEQIAMMKRIKGLFDPNGILNPGKIL